MAHSDENVTVYIGQKWRKMSTIFELMLAIKKDCLIFYHKDTGIFDNSPVSEEELKHLSENRNITIENRNSILLPRYEEINHKDIMRLFVRECIEDKEIRKQLFYILRRTDYMDAFLDKLHELDLYQDFEDVCGDIYIQIFYEWAEENDLVDRFS